MYGEIDAKMCSQEALKVLTNEEKYARLPTVSRTERPAIQELR